MKTIEDRALAILWDLVAAQEANDGDAVANVGQAAQDLLDEIAAAEYAERFASYVASLKEANHAT